MVQKLFLSALLFQEKKIHILNCPGQAPVLASTHPPILTVLCCFFEVLRVTAHHAKFLHSESKGRSAELPCCSDALWAPQHQASKVCTHGLVWSVLPLRHEIRVLQATTECCGNLATRLQVGPLSSTIQLFPLLGWPQ